MIFDRPCEELDVETTTSFSGQPSEGRMTLGRVNWRFFSQPLTLPMPCMRNFWYVWLTLFQSKVPSEHRLMFTEGASRSRENRHAQHAAASECVLLCLACVSVCVSMCVRLVSPPLCVCVCVLLRGCCARRDGGADQPGAAGVHVLQRVL